MLHFWFSCTFIKKIPRTDFTFYRSRHPLGVRRMRIAGFRSAWRCRIAKRQRPFQAGALACQDSLAEWSKAPDSSSGGAIRVGSNPTAVILAPTGEKVIMYEFFLVTILLLVSVLMHLYKKNLAPYAPGARPLCPTTSCLQHSGNS